MTFDIPAYKILLEHNKLRVDLDVAVMDGAVRKTTLAVNVAVPMHIDDPRATLRKLITEQVQQKYNEWKKLTSLEAQAVTFMANLETYLNGNIDQ